MLRKFSRLLDQITQKYLGIRYPKLKLAIERVIAEKLSYLEKSALWDLAEIISDNEKKTLEGIVIETGCALGGSAIVIATAKSKARKFFIYDVFGMIPSPSEKDDRDIHQRYETIVSGKSKGIGGNLYYGYEKNLYEKVVNSFEDFGLNIEENNIHLIKGLYQDTLKIDSSVSFAHIDCDWYDSVLICLTQIYPKLVKGGTIVIDDYYSWSGCKLAVDDYFKNQNRDSYKFIRKSRLHIVKITT